MLCVKRAQHFKNSLVWTNKNVSNNNVLKFLKNSLVCNHESNFSSITFSCYLYTWCYLCNMCNKNNFEPRLFSYSSQSNIQEAERPANEFVIKCLNHIRFHKKIQISKLTKCLTGDLERLFFEIQNTNEMY